jgi:hypothetical protein
LAVAEISLSASTLSPFLGAYQSLPVKYPQLDRRMDILLVHETLAPLPLISKPQASLSIEALFATVELGLLVPLSFSLLLSQVGWVTLHQLSYLKTGAHDNEEREVTCPYLFQICTSSQVWSWCPRTPPAFVDCLTLTLDGFCDGSKDFFKLSGLLSKLHLVDHSKNAHECLNRIHAMRATYGGTYGNKNSGPHLNAPLDPNSLMLVETRALH